LPVCRRAAKSRSAIYYRWLLAELGEAWSLSSSGL
jgi:hypothetical protein